MRKGLLDPLEMHLMDYPDLLVRGSDMQLPFTSLMRLKQIGGLVLQAQESSMVVFNLYDSWLKEVSNYTAFSRLMMILRAIHVDQYKTKTLLSNY